MHRKATVARAPDGALGLGGVAADVLPMAALRPVRRRRSSGKASRSKVASPTRSPARAPGFEFRDQPKMAFK
jgi:hypothetical protein